MDNDVGKTYQSDARLLYAPKHATRDDVQPLCAFGSARLDVMRPLIFGSSSKTKHRATSVIVQQLFPIPTLGLHVLHLDTSVGQGTACETKMSMLAIANGIYIYTLTFRVHTGMERQSWTIASLVARIARCSEDH